MAAMLKQQGLNTKGILKGPATKEEVPPLPAPNGKLEVFTLIPWFPSNDFNFALVYLMTYKIYGSLLCCIGSNFLMANWLF